MKKNQSNNTATTQISRRDRRTVQIYPQNDGRTLIVVTPVAEKKAKGKAKPKKALAKAKPVTVKALPAPPKSAVRAKGICRVCGSTSALMASGTICTKCYKEKQDVQQARWGKSLFSKSLDGGKHGKK